MTKFDEAHRRMSRRLEQRNAEAKNRPKHKGVHPATFVRIVASLAKDGVHGTVLRRLRKSDG